jgi:hypothetical protein
MQRAGEGVLALNSLWIIRFESVHLDLRPSLATRVCWSWAAHIRWHYRAPADWGNEVWSRHQGYVQPAIVSGPSRQQSIRKDGAYRSTEGLLWDGT